MKKLLLVGIAATAMLASCSNDETVGTPEQNAAISFSSFVDKSTRAIVPDKDMQDEWAVWGFWNKENNVFDNVPQKVDKNGVYSPVAYWFTQRTYHFVGLSPYNAVEYAEVEISDGINVSLNFTNNGETDLLYAKDDTYGNGEIENIPENAVGMIFDHMLSKVKFTFENAMVTESYKFIVKEIKITDAKQTATLTINGENKEWDELNGSMTLDFAEANNGNNIEVNANGSSKDLLIIPTKEDVSYTVTFTLELYQGETKMGTYNHETSIKDLTFDMGKSYNFKAVITPNNVNPEIPDGRDTEIKFTTEVNEWTTPDIDKKLEGYEKSGGDSTEE